MNWKLLGLGLFWMLVGQVAAWYQTNGQFISNWLKTNTIWAIIIFALPIGYAYIEGTRILVQAFNGVLWPTRLLGFAMGILSFTLLTKFNLGESITLKTGITLLLALTIVLIQVFWKTN